jgi:hypothetical protein
MKETRRFPCAKNQEEIEFDEKVMTLRVCKKSGGGFECEEKVMTLRECKKQ